MFLFIDRDLVFYYPFTNIFCVARKQYMFEMRRTVGVKNVNLSKS